MVPDEQCMVCGNATKRETILAMYEPLCAPCHQQWIDHAHTKVDDIIAMGEGGIRKVYENWLEEQTHPCPRCEENPINKPDYICRECRYGC